MRGEAGTAAVLAEASARAAAAIVVFGVPDPEMGEAVKAVVQPVDPSAADADLEAELIDYCRIRLASYKCPRTVDFAPELPRDPNGKLFKRLLRDALWGGWLQCPHHLPPFPSGDPTGHNGPM